jgi:hypothetical protein
MLEETNMNFHKRFILITALAIAIFAAIAVGPYSRTVTPVRADRPTPAVVVLTCTDVGSAGLVAVSNSDSSLTVPALGTACAIALEDVVAQGYFIEPANGSAGAGADVVWTLVQGRSRE